MTAIDEAIEAALAAVTEQIGPFAASDHEDIVRIAVEAAAPLLYADGWDDAVEVESRVSDG